MDTSTGLLYMGSGQYYDPHTGRFLSRNAKPDQTNPYVPWGGNPTGALFTPLALLSLVYSRKKKRGTLDTIIILVVLGVVLGMSLSACQQPTPSSPAPGGGNQPTPPPSIGGPAGPTPTQNPTPQPNGTPVPTAQPISCPIASTLTNKFRITADEITSAGGTMMDYFQKEVKDDPALFMARVAMGESADNGERSRIIWLITTRVVLGFNNSNLRSSATMESSIWDHFGPPSSLHRELLETSPNGGYQFEDVHKALSITDPPAQATGNILTMLYPDDSEISDFESMYKVAQEAYGAQNEAALKTTSNSDLAIIKGYDGYLAPNKGVTAGITHFRGGRSTQQFSSSSGNIWDDEYPMDDVFFGMISCKDEKNLIRLVYDPSSNGQGAWLAKLFAKSDPDQIACPN